LEGYFVFIANRSKKLRNGSQAGLSWAAQRGGGAFADDWTRHLVLFCNNSRDLQPFSVGSSKNALA